MRKSLIITVLLLFYGGATMPGQSPGSGIFNSEKVHDIQISFNQQNFWDSLQMYKEEGDQIGEYTYMMCTVDFNGTIIESTGVRLKGNSSYWGGGKKKSIKLKFNEFVSGQKLDGLKKINLNNNFNDPTLMREKLFLDMLQNNGVFAPRCAYARVFINEEYWGLYTIVDHVDKVFLLMHFGNKGGNLFKGDNDPGLPCANLSFHPDPWEYRNCYTLKTNEDIDDWSDLEELIFTVNHTPLSDFYDNLNPILNPSSFINAWATNIVFVNVDSYVETGHNYYIYHNPVNNKFEWITWDVNEAFGLWNVGMPLEQLYNLNILYLPPNPEIERPLSFFMLQDPDFRKMYLDKVYDLVRNEFSPEILFPRINLFYDLIKEDVYRDPNKVISFENFETNIFDDVYIPDYPGWVPGLKSFIQQRHDILMTQLSDLGYSFTGNDPSNELTDISFHLYPNPASNYVVLYTQSPQIKNTYLELIDASGRELLRKEMIFPSERIDISPYCPGVYYIKVVFEDSVKIARFTKL